MPVVNPLATADICDQFEQQPDSIAIVSPVFKDFGALPAFAGGMVTLRCADDNSKVRELVAQAGDGNVLVVDGGASMHCALLGGNLAELAAQNNWSGIVINGCVRDSDELRRATLGIRALAAMPRRSEKKQTGEINIPLRFADATFMPGHFLYADNDGIVLSAERL